MEKSLFQGDLVNSRRVLYTPSTFAKQNLLHIQEIGELKAQKPHISRRSKLESYLFFMVMSGSGKLRYNGKTFPLKEGDYVFIDCTQPYSHETSTDLWTLRWVHFYGPTLPEIYKKYQERGGLPMFRSSHLTEYTSIWNILFSHASGNEHVRDMKINEGLSSLLTLLMIDSWQKELSVQSTKRSELNDIQDYLMEHHTEKITLDQLTDHFFVNKYYLTRIFKEQFGISINNYLLQVRITHAKQLLRFSSASIEEIGLLTGIGPLYYFSRVFKKVEGISPSNYRSQWKS